MKYIVIICMLFTSCSLFKKTVNTQKQDISKSTILLKDSSGSLVVEDVKKMDLTQWGTVIIDSSYDTWTNVVTKDYGDSVITVRTTKEKGQKKTEQVSHTSKRDSASSMITEHSQLQELQQEDSTAVIETKQKDVGRTALFPWWLWLIAAGVLALGWWKRNSILELFT
jgi:hypothetical protein